MKLPKAEEKLMQHLWNLESAFMRDLLNKYDDPKPATTTLATLLTRLRDKNYINYKLFGKSREYYPLITKKDYHTSQVKNLISTFFNDSTAQFASFFTKETEMSKTELQDLRDLIDKEIRNK